MHHLGRYRLLMELGRGGMADVLLAITDSSGVEFNKIVVLKRMRKEFSEDLEVRTMFADEARIAARLHHPNIVETYEVAEVEGEMVLVLEYLDGQPLNRILSAESPAPLAIKLAILSEVLSGLDYAHKAKDYDGTPLGIVHRDVSPHNIFVTYDGQVKVVDFGIAKAAGRAARTRTGYIKGKLTYMAPEQARNQLVDHRTDLFAAGIVLFEACTGQRMWGGDEHASIHRRLLKEDYIRSPRDLKSDLPPKLDEICRKALAPDPAERYESADAMREALDVAIELLGPRPTSRQIGTWLRGAFAELREYVDGIIERQLSTLKQGDAQALTNVTMSIPGGTPRGEPVPAAAERTASLVSDPPASRSTSTLTVTEAPDLSPLPKVQARPSRPSLGRWAAGLFGIAVCLAGVLAWHPRSRSSDPQVTEPPANGNDVVLTIRAEPPEATFRIDHGPELPNPYTGHYVRAPGNHVVSASAPGWVTKDVTISFSESTSLRLVLNKESRD